MTKAMATAVLGLVWPLVALAIALFCTECAITACAQLKTTFNVFTDYLASSR